MFLCSVQYLGGNSIALNTSHIHSRESILEIMFESIYQK